MISKQNFPIAHVLIAVDFSWICKFWRYSAFWYYFCNLTLSSLSWCLVIWMSWYLHFSLHSFLEDLFLTVNVYSIRKPGRICNTWHLVTCRDCMWTISYEVPSSSGFSNECGNNGIYPATVGVCRKLKFVNYRPFVKCPVAVVTV